MVSFCAKLEKKANVVCKGGVAMATDGAAAPKKVVMGQTCFLSHVNPDENDGTCDLSTACKTIGKSFVGS